MNYKVYYTLADGDVRYEFVDSLCRALCAALEFPPDNAVKSRIVGPDGKEWLYRLKGV